MLFFVFALIFLACLGIAKVINSARRTLTINGAAIYLVLAGAFIVFNLVMASRSDLGPYQLGRALGRSIAPAAFVGFIALYYFFKFRSDKIHERIKKLRDQGLRDRD
ncbi:hypothetical protein ASD69_05685 [Lysobacter sp. Root604]|nr:hypothetical protein ASD69_05685 [Lysobacter sp. Root604]